MKLLISTTAYVGWLLLLMTTIYGQGDTLILGIDGAIELSLEHSIPAQLSSHKLLRSQIQYEQFTTELLPVITFNSAPISFNRTFVQRYDINEKADIYVTQQNIYSFFNLEVSKPLGRTGGRIFLNSNVSRLQNLGANPFTNYTTSPINLGLSQPIGGFNPYKWSKIKEPIRLQEAEKRNILEREQLSKTTVELYFDLLVAQRNMELTSQNGLLLDTLLQIAEKRNLIGGIPKDELLQLKLEILEYEAEYQQQQNEVARFENRLKNFLGVDSDYILKLETPEFFEVMDISTTRAIDYCLLNHPSITEMELGLLEAEETYEKTFKDSRFQATLNASIGLNQSDTSFLNSIRNPLDQELFFLSFDVPLFDWGRRKQDVKIAEIERDMQAYTVKDQRMNLRQELESEIVKHEYFSEQKNRIDVMIILATEQLEISQRKYASGKMDLLTLSVTRAKKNQILRSRVNLLREYWIWLYTLRSLTLYDFTTGLPISP